MAALAPLRLSAALGRRSLLASSSRQPLAVRPLHASAVRLAAPPIRDHAIRARLVRLVDPDTGSLHEQPQSPASILRSIDPTRYWLQQVSAGDDETLPICRLVDKKAEFDKEKARRAEKKLAAAGGAAGDAAPTAKGAGAIKELVLTWSATPHDVQHRLQQARQHLHRKGIGARVDVKIISKTGKGVRGGSTAASRAELLAHIAAFLCDEPPSETLHVRRKGEVEMLRNESQATVSFETAKGRGPGAAAT
jgi:translation initiation factor IF-3